jgi:Ca2+/Na+ antiporter
MDPSVNDSEPNYVGAAIALIAIAIGFANFVAFVVIAERIGGDALTGYHTPGHWYLKHKGQFVEVTQKVFQYSQIHALSTIITHIIALCAMLYLVRVIKYHKKYK